MKKIILIIIAISQLSITNAQLSNLDFENWTIDSLTGSAYPTGWLGYTDGYISQVTPAYNGSYAMSVNVWYYYVKSTAIQKSSITSQPTSIEGYYKYTQNTVYSLAGDTISDTAMVSILLTKWNGFSMQADTVGYGKIPLLMSVGYSHFLCPINYFSAITPDSVTVTLDPSIVRRYGNFTYWQATTLDGKCSYLTVDNLSLNTSPSAVQETESVFDFKMFPNPTSGQFTISSPEDKAEIIVTDMLGRQILKSQTTQKTMNLQLDDKGVYIIYFKIGQKTTTRKLIVN